jgi:hypothetical protein
MVSGTTSGRISQARCRTADDIKQLNYNIGGTLVIFSKLATIALAPVEMAFVAWYISYWDLFPKYSVQRIVAWLAFISTVVIIPLLQIELYKRINALERADDLFIGVLIFTESMLSVALLFFFLNRRRNRKVN